MKVYKFGGASVRNADGVQNLLKIIGDERDLFIIVSAMGKTTNALEKVFEGLQKGDKAFSMEHITALRQYHAEIVNELYGAPTRLEKIERLFGELEQVATETVYRPEDAELWYDTVVAFGELISTTDHFGVPLRTGYRQLLARYATLLPHRTATQGRLGRYRRIADSAAQRHETVEGPYFHRAGLYRRCSGRHDHDPGTRRFGLLGSGGGQYPRRGIHVGMERRGRHPECRPEGFPRMRCRSRN